ncbi:hypothetical protein OU798_15575 [Prolixibacteraceae bacterium Z1-6]|uniref:DUF4843 domain-containing protein n=1 Tax=Draconibacterium aestuarii TaxID=2998507 RepID=A0A9X3F738_9BACT|nr:hypothetical protein [Prolixibacteraceae bacterium Z1-6]
MIKLQKFGTFLALFLMITGLISCNDDSNTVPFEVNGDVFVSKKMVAADGETSIMYATAYYAFGNQPMMIAKVNPPTSAEFVLEAIDNTSKVYAAITGYSKTPPMAGNYIFTVLHEDVPHQTNDIVLYNDIDFTTITNVEMASETLTVEWDKETSEAESHRIYLINQDGDYIFKGPLLPTINSKYEVNTSSAGSWPSGYPNIGDVLTMELHAIVFEEGSTINDQEYNIQEIAISEQEITWE